MRLVTKYVFLFSIVFNLLSCQHPSYFKTKDTSISLNSDYANDPQTSALIQPYKDKLEAEMNEVLVISAEEFPAERGKPETKLGNLVADLSMRTGSLIYNTDNNHHIDFCLLNFGGLRTSLPKGEITRGKIFELMPFENELVVVTISKEKMRDLSTYIRKVGGQPISDGFKYYSKKDESNPKMSNDSTYLIQHSTNAPINHVKVLTTDYLANGGDKMNFFLNPVKSEPLGIKLRDAIIEYCIRVNKANGQLVGKLDGRITFE